MVKKRVIPCLDVADGRVVKGINFRNLREMGEPVELARRYSELGADELVFLDITATLEGRGPILDVIGRAADERVVVAASDHDGRVVAAVEQGAVAGVQFHPERSGPAGARLLENVLRWSRSA